MPNSITFGFYKGLGDFISDSYIIDYFYKNNFKVTIILASWLKDLAENMFPNTNIIPYKEGKEILKFQYSDDFVFLSPNYLHPIDMNYKSIPLYLAKYRAVKKNKSSKTKIIRPSYLDLLLYYFKIKKTFLNEHFYCMSYFLVKKYFPDIPDIKLEIEDNKLKNKKNIERIFIFPFSGFKPKDYPLENYYNLAKFFKEKYNISPEFYVVPSDRKKLSNIEKEFSVKSKSLVDLAEKFKETDLVICSDSGPGHLAAKFGANVAVLYSTTNPQKYKPIGNGKIITIKASNSNIKNISVEEILKKINVNFSFGGKL